MDGRRQVGESGEAIAAAHLTARGMTVLERNWRSPGLGEVDIVARDGQWLVVCEVKTRTGTGYGDPLEAVTAAKHTRLRRLAAAWLGTHEERFAGVRIDLVAVLLRAGRPPLVRHVQAVAP